MLSENQNAIGINGTVYQLERMIGEGGEGRVFTVKNQPDIVVKIYKKQSPQQEEKLRYMLTHPIPNLWYQRNLPATRIAWPQDIVKDAQGVLAGYVMPRIEGCIEIFEIERGCKSPKAKRLYPNYTWALNVVVAHNLALSIEHLHKYSCIIGDMNSKNIMVDANGSIVFLDTDSFDLINKDTGVHYKCSAGTEEYIAPELQGMNLRSDRAKFTIYSDYFSMAIHIFQLLMDDFHPFQCVQLIPVKDSTSSNPRMDRVANGQSPYVKYCAGMDIPPASRKLDEVMHQYLIDDFKQTFDYDASTIQQRKAMRTSAAKWASDLQNLRWECENGGLVQCSVNPRHWYLASIGACGACKAEARMQSIKPEPKPSPNPVGPDKPDDTEDIIEMKKSRKLGILLAISVIANIGLAIFAGDLNQQKEEYMDDYWQQWDMRDTLLNEKVELEEQKSDLEKQYSVLQNNYSNLESKYSRLEDDYDEIKDAYDFYDSYARVMNSDDSMQRYHHYGCSEFDTSSFLIHNINYAKNEGYSPCAFCCGDEY